MMYMVKFSRNYLLINNNFSVNVFLKIRNKLDVDVASILDGFTFGLTLQ